MKIDNDNRGGIVLTFAPGEKIVLTEPLVVGTKIRFVMEGAFSITTLKWREEDADF